MHRPRTLASALLWAALATAPGAARAYHGAFPSLQPFTVLSGDTVSAGSGVTVNVNGPGAGGVAGSPGRTGAASAILGPGVIVSFPGANVVGGAAGSALQALATLKADLRALPSDVDLRGAGPVSLGTLDVGAGAGVLVPGVYRFQTASLGASATLTFFGAGEYVLDIEDGLVIGAGATVSLAAGANSANILWNVGSAVAIAASTFRGVLAAEGFIAVGTGATVTGKLYSQDGNVAFNGSGAVVVDDAGLPPRVLVNGVPGDAGVLIRAPLGQSVPFAVSATDPDGQLIQVARADVPPGLSGPPGAVGGPTAVVAQAFTTSPEQVGSEVAVDYLAGDLAGTVASGRVRLAAVLPEADLSVTAGGAAVKGGRSGVEATYSFVVANAGPEEAEDVLLVDPLPAGTSFLQVGTSQGSCAAPPVGAGGTVSCALGILGVGDQATVTLRVRVDRPARGGPLPRSTATVSAATGDPDVSNDVATVGATLGAPRP